MCLKMFRGAREGNEPRDYIKTDYADGSVYQAADSRQCLVGVEDLAIFSTLRDGKQILQAEADGYVRLPKQLPWDKEDVYMWVRLGKLGLISQLQVAATEAQEALLQTKGWSRCGTRFAVPHDRAPHRQYSLWCRRNGLGFLADVAIADGRGTNLYLHARGYGRVAGLFAGEPPSSIQGAICAGPSETAVSLYVRKAPGLPSKSGISKANVRAGTDHPDAYRSHYPKWVLAAQGGSKS